MGKCIFGALAIIPINVIKNRNAEIEKGRKEERKGRKKMIPHF
jgi:hypothetical protein